MAGSVAIGPSRQKVCPGCREEKPLELFQMKTVRGLKRPTYCKRCHVAQATAWRKKNPERHRVNQSRHVKRRARRAVLYRELHEQGKTYTLHELDAMRRALVENPPELSSEADRVAYFRGFMAGAKRSEEESERFERLKDLCHRIASERANEASRRFTRREYEDDLSAAYEGLLLFLRKRKGHNSLEHERREAAQAIRHALIDAKRSEGPFAKSGKMRYEAGGGSLLSEHEREDGSSPEIASQDRPGDAIALSIDLGAMQLEPRSQLILERLASGYDQTAIAKELGLSLSRVCQILREIREERPELEEALAG